MSYGTPFIDELYRTGYLKNLYDFRSGSGYDFGVNANHISFFDNNADYTQDGIVVKNSTSVISVFPDSVKIQNGNGWTLIESLFEPSRPTTSGDTAFSFISFTAPSRGIYFGTGANLKVTGVTWSLDGTNVGANVPSTGVTFKWFTIAGSFDHSTKRIRSFVNGIFSAQSNANTGVDASDTYTKPTTRVLGCRGIFITGYILSISRNLTDDEQLRIYNELESIKWETRTASYSGLNYVFKTHFGAYAKNLSQGGVIGSVFEHTPFQFSDTTGRFKITTDTHNGRLVKVIECTTAPGAGQGLYLPYSYDATKWEYWYKASGGTAYTQVTDNSRISASGEKTIFNMAIGDKMIYSDITGDFCILKRRV